MTVNNNQYVTAGKLKASRCLHELVADEIAPGTGIDADRFWASLADLVDDFGERNKQLLSKRDKFQARIDDWYAPDAGKCSDSRETRELLTDIGYLAIRDPMAAVRTAILMTSRH